MAKTMHSIRIDDDLWKLFLVKAQNAGKTGASVIDEMMQGYVDGRAQAGASPAQGKQPQSEILRQFQNRAASEGIDPTDALEALMTLYIEGHISFKKTVKAVLK